MRVAINKKTPSTGKDKSLSDLFNEIGEHAEAIAAAVLLMAGLAFAWLKAKGRDFFS